MTRENAGTQASKKVRVTHNTTCGAFKPPLALAISCCVEKKLESWVMVFLLQQRALVQRANVLSTTTATLQLLVVGPQKTCCCSQLPTMPFIDLQPMLAAQM